ncbi:YcxB family protein [Spirochaeta isovalerica]|uniref:YcxB-like C-terminal domain-containing protein n=1 Tax=Spirochaeta isovalerica TaxID=150 RepID=A0A841RHN1_9SPIO|nr:YcxB family protein [Spirochaeta isovalerica]MBB6482677.1 hypothetical protein [Spirochaeta isovalerica]
MKYKVDLNYSTGLIARTTLSYLNKSMGWSFYTAMGISLLITLFLYFSGNRTVLLPVFLGVLILGVLIYLRMFAFYFSGANGEYKKLRGSRISATIRENGITFGTGGETLRWKDLSKFSNTDEAFLFFVTKDKYIICPSSDIDEETRSFIFEKLDEFRISRQ